MGTGGATARRLCGGGISSIGGEGCDAVGGPSTALALAISKRWSTLVTPSVLLGVLGYATGNYIGVRIAYLIRPFTG